MLKFISNSEAETFEIGRKIGTKLKIGDVVVFFGDLGVGKTAFTRGICDALDIKNIHSPTFTLVNEYSGKLPVYHFDAYRITADDWVNSGFDEYLYNDGLCIIEWGENVADILPKESIEIHIKKNMDFDDCYRDIEVNLKQASTSP